MTKTKMKVTTDTLTGKLFRWNDTVEYMGKIVPARITSRTSTHLAPDRVVPELLARLNRSEPRILITGQVREPGTYCELCGANEGQPHHDSRAYEGVVVLAKYKGWLYCQPCKEGALEARLEAKQVKQEEKRRNPMTNKTKLKTGHRRAGKPIGDPEDRNAERAQEALWAVRTFQDVTGLEAIDGLETAILDLLASLAHLCDREQLDYADLLRQARNHYEAETTASNARENNGAQFEGISIAR